MQIYPSMKKKMINFLLLSFISLLLINIWVYFLQPGMIFFPYSQLNSTPQDWGLKYEDVILTTSDQVKIHGWYLPAKKSRQVVLFFHGNAGNISHRGDSLKLFHSLGLNVFIIDYRGYGKSEGVMSEMGSYRDAMAAWDHLVKQRGFKPGNIVIFGRSLGGAIATQLATKVNAQVLIVESTFSSVKDMADIMMPIISKLIYLRYQFNTEKIISQVNSPVLLMHSQDDEIIPYELGQKVFSSAKSPKYHFELTGSHNEGFTRNVAEYKKEIKWFLEKEY